MTHDPFAERAWPRRLAFLILCLLVAAGLLALLLRVLGPGGWTAWEWVVLAAYIGILPWNAISAANGLLGFAILMLSRDAPAVVVPQLRAGPGGPPGLRTALALCIRKEDMAQVLPLMAPLLDGLEAEGAGDRFVLWLLSDTPEGPGAAEEAAAVAAFAMGREGRRVPVRYRRRVENTGFKAGNVMDFLDHHAGGIDLVVTLDADSAMSAGAVLRLVGCMEADPKLAIVQHLVVGRPVGTAFPRLFQFGMRAGMRIWATGQGWWQLDEGPYWGHNAVLRVAPFREHARLGPLPDGSAILSHDQVEAVRLHGAGWKVRCLPMEDGSQEGNPPALPEFLERDARWGAGNMQYWHLIRLPGLTPMARWQFAQAILLYFGAPLAVVVLLAAAGNVASGGGAGTPHGALLALMAATWVSYYASKLLGYAEVLLGHGRARAYGGRAVFLRGAAAEMVFSLFFEPVSLLSKALALAALPFRRRLGWGAQNRAARGVSLGVALRLLWPHLLLGLGLGAVLASVPGTAVFWAMPFLLPLVLAVPFCLVTASPGFSRWLVARGICAVPEEGRQGHHRPVRVDGAAGMPAD